MDTSEKNFEAQIEEHLTTHGFIKRDYHDFDAVNAIDSQMLFDFIYATQPEKWQKLETQHGSQVKSNFLKRLTKEIELRGTLDVFRRGVIDLGCKFDLTYFKPEDNLNPDHSRLYQANILTIMRQVHYSPKDTNKSLDTVVFLNGLPVFTIELKNPLTNQTVENAIWQYCHTRNPNDPLLKFGRCIAHFAVDTDLVYMTTHLQGENTRFLPFNQGNDKAAGNPINPNGFKTAYFWEQVLEGDSLLDILNNFAQLRDILDDKGIKTGKQEIIFPRYHQLDAVRKMVSHAQTKGTGDSYLIQHSAGSGKSETIAWLVLRLSSLKNAQNQRVFDSILVITDRTNLDKQLQRTIRGFNHVAGTITTIDKNKSTNLAKALEQGDDIIISTLQTFRFALEKMTNLNGKKFAVVIDEAHSSQSGESKDAVQKILSLNSPSNIPTNTQTDDEDEPDNEDQINEVVVSIQRQKGKSPHISYFAFTATPKDKTLEIFGIKVLQADGSKKSVPFSLYSMRQAIDEGFIKDVLQNYTTFACYFNLTKIVAENPDYDKKTAAAVLKTYADEHEHAISMKTAAMVDHFHSHAAKLINGKAKAMIVTRSRLQAARYKLAFDSYLKTKGYPYKALVAFSGSVSDTEKPLPYLHTESNMNGVPESKTVETFQQNEYRFLIVARKFQTGFNQPLLQTMYVDKKLIGIEAVQTLSRLNRTTANKGDVFVLDFVNGTKDIEESFQDYYQATILSEATDPNKLYDLKDRLDKFYLFEKAEIETFASVYFPTKQNPKPNQAKLHPILNPMVDRYKERKPEEKADFRSLLGAYVRTYAFLVQILTFPDADLEKFYQFARFLLKKLPINRDRLPIELVNHISMDSYKIKKTSEDDENGKPKPILLKAEDGYLKPLSGLGTGQPITENLAPLSEVLEYINEHYGTDFVHEDKLAFFSEDVFRRLDKSEGIYRALDPKINPSQETQKLAFETYFREILEDMIDTNFDIYKKLSDDTDFGNLFRQVMFNNFQKDLSDRRDQNLG